MTPRTLAAVALALACFLALTEARPSIAANAALRRKNWGGRVLAKRGCNTTQQAWCNSIDSANPGTLNADELLVYTTWSCAGCPKAVDFCGSNAQCGDRRNCYKCPAGGWNCGSSSVSACGVDGIQYVDQPANPTPVVHDLCGSNSQCGAGNRCYKCSWGGWNCGYDSYDACQQNDATYVGQDAPPPATSPHSLCGANAQCGGSADCYKCPSGGWNCGFSSKGACGFDGVPTADVPLPAPHSLCGTAAQCPGGKCYKCPSFGWNCGATSVAACGFDNVEFVV